tara:strand:+ start:31723 stop:32097 length:375 start_codon:yes stop_codon:yes gene_type:complete
MSAKATISNTDTDNLSPLDHFDEDWQKIVLLERNEMRHLTAFDARNWELRLTLYSDGSGVGCEKTHRSQHPDDTLAPPVDRFFPLGKQQLKNYLILIYNQLHDKNIDKAEELFFKLNCYMSHEG